MNYFKITQKSIRLHQSISTFILLVVVFTSSLCFSQDEATATNLGEFAFEEELINYGTINQNANGVRTFKFKNTGKSPIVISTVKTTCGCTVPKYSKKPILPGESSSIDVKYATNRIGGFSKSITIVSNASEPQKKLKIKGNIIAKTTIALK